MTPIFFASRSCNSTAVVQKSGLTVPNENRPYPPFPGHPLAVVTYNPEGDQ